MAAEKSDSKSSNNVKYDDYGKILDELPFGISVQTLERQILYENKKAKELVGSFLFRQCYNRWHYLEDRGDNPCPDCPAAIGFEDKKQHKIFRETISENGNSLFIEITFIPLFDKNGKLDKFIEVMHKVERDEEAKILAKHNLKDVLKQVQVSIVKFGNLGGEVIVTDNLKFIQEDETEDFLTTVTIYIFTGLIQGFDDQVGLYGPLPVLDKIAYEMLAYLFRIENKEASDPRLHGLEPCMLFIFFPRHYFFLFKNREEIENFIRKNIESWGKLENINEKNLEIFVDKLQNHLQESI